MLVASTFDIQWPDPYFGLGTGLAQTPLYEDIAGAVVQKKRFRGYVSFGFPMKLKRLDDTLVDLTITPEFGWSPTIYQGNLMLGLEGQKPGAYRDALSAFVWNVNAGMHYALLGSPSDPIREDGTVFDTNDKNSFALLLSGAIGPQFYITDKFNLRLMLNPRIIMGQIAKRTFTADSRPWIGYMFNINLQFEIGRWAKEAYDHKVDKHRK